jgi:2-polyprenyl-3-methyl-5-hydroxy-6-metoxy-1,4-benzoquinol methylase
MTSSRTTTSDEGSGHLAHLYGDGSGLDLKWEVMRRHRTEPESFEDWLIRQLPLGRGSRVLDAGAGSGRFAIPLARQLRDQGGSVVALDAVSDVMSPIAAAVRTDRLPIETVVGDAADPPVESGSFDVVLAAHVLYHLEDFDAGVRALAGALRPGGVFAATTNAAAGMPELYQLHAATMRYLDLPFVEQPADTRFAVENGAAMLRQVFGEVDLQTYDGGFTATSADPIFSYYAGTELYRGPIRDERLDWQRRLLISPTFVHFAQQRVEEADGRLLVNKDVGAFLCKF